MTTRTADLLPTIPAHLEHQGLQHITQTCGLSTTVVRRHPTYTIVHVHDPKRSQYGTWFMHIVPSGPEDVGVYMVR